VYVTIRGRWTSAGTLRAVAKLNAGTDKDAPPSGTWHPDAATTISGIREDQPYQHVYRRVLVDLGDPADLTIYLVAVQP
jgi:hypothetical protein